MAGDDTAAIDAALRDRLEGLLDALCPGWVKRGRKAYPAPKSRTDLGSWQVDLAGPTRGRWIRFSQRAKGGPIGLVAYVRSGERGTRPTREDFDWIREFLGWHAPSRAESEAARARAAERTRALAADAKRQRRSGVERARALFARARTAAGTPAETYLRARGIDVAALGGVPDALRFVPALSYLAPPLSDGAPPRRLHAGPALVAGIAAPGDGGIVAAHATWLAPDGRGKATIVDPDTGETLPARKMRGAAGGGCVRLAEAAGDLVLGEGLESTLSVMMATGMPGWAALSLSNLGAWLPPAVRTVWLAIDSDERDPKGAAKAKQAAFAAHAAAGRAWRELKPPRGCDWNDVLRRPEVA